MQCTAGTQYKNFRIDRVVDLPELQMQQIELVHEPTGASVLHLAADDDENLFSLSFRTWPKSSNGVAHILEHITLCGSEKFPIRDPFFEMARRSLNTFMNALTGADFTCYPASTQVPKDFYNLLEVYLDAVFHPRLLIESFRQEGHRLEFEKPDDPLSPLQFKGVVYNEMKGALASPDTRLNEALMSALFPDLTYGINSGGDPKEIPNLTYEELKEFHKTFYHPSRCLFFFYGNLPLEQHLDFLEEHALRGVEPAKPFAPLPKQPRFSAPVERTLTYPIAEHEASDEKTLVGFSFLTCSILEQEELLALQVLDLVLMGTDASPLKMALLKSGLCKQADSQLDSELSEIPWTIVCKGCKENATPQIEELIRTTLCTIAEEGLPSNLVEGAIHQLEMARCEITGNSSPYGLSLFFRSALLKQHGGRPEEGLQIHTLFSKLRDRVRDPGYLPAHLQKALLKNPHLAKVTMRPDTALETVEKAEERRRLDAIQNALTEKEKREIVAMSRHLHDYQESTEDPEILPKVTLQDVPHDGREFALQMGHQPPFEIYTHPCFTNQIAYVDLLFALPEIAEEDLPLFRLFTILLTQVGSGGRNYKEHLDYILEHTGGIGASLDLNLQVEDSSKMRPVMAVKGKALHRKLDKLFPLMRDAVSSPDFTDQGRIRELLMQHYNSLQNSLNRSALRFAVNLAASSFGVPSRIMQAWYGLEYYWKIKEVVAEFETNPHRLIDKLQEFQSQCFALPAELVIDCEAKSLDVLKAEGYFGLMNLKEKPTKPWHGQYSVPQVSSQGRIISSPVSFTTLLFPSVAFVHPSNALLSLAAEIMDNVTLHKRIREQGGAYGSGAVHAGMSGQFYFYSYRDPHLASTVAAFKEAALELAAGEFEESDLIEAKLGILQDLDAPVAPGSRAITAYSRLRCGRTPEVRQQYRDRLLSADVKAVREAVKAHLLPRMEEGVLVTFGSKELLEKENTLLKAPLTLHTI